MEDTSPKLKTKVEEQHSSNGAYNVTRQRQSLSPMRRQSLLAAQMQKVIPDSSDLKCIVGSEKMKQMLDQHFSGKTFRRISMPHIATRRRVSFLASRPRASSVSQIQSEIPEHHIPVEEGEIHHSDLRKLPFSLHEKRKYRTSITFAMKRKPWYTKFLSRVKYFCKKHASKFRLWNDSLKTIEGQHGAGVVSYFLFLRWLFIMNALIFLINFFFLILPHILLYDYKEPIKIQFPELENHVLKILKSPISIVSSDDKNLSVLSWSNRSIPWNTRQKIKFTNQNITELNTYCHQKYTEEVQEMSKGGGVSTFVQNLLQGTGWMETTLMFLGSYTSNDFSYLGHRYYVPVAFLCTQMLTVILCLFMMVKYSSFGLKESFLTRSDLQKYYNLVFCGWDYGIVNPDSATFQHERFFSSLMAYISENRIKKKLAMWSTQMWTKLYAIRIFINCLVVLWIIGAYMIIYNVALYQMREKQMEGKGKTGIRAFLVKVLPPVVILATQSISPFIMDILVKFEKYHAQTENNVTLMRNAFLRLSSAFVLIMTFHSAIACEPRDACGKGISDCRCPRCWETFVGQQLYNLTIVDLFIYIGIFLIFDVLRDYIITRFDNKCTRAIGRQTFFLPIQVLYPVYSQTILWLGVFYAPLLPAVMVLKLQCVFYIKKAMVLKYSEPSKTSYKASRFNSMFMIILMLSFFAVTAVHFYTLEKIKTSHGCSPFRSADLMINAIHDSLQNWSGVLLFWTYFHQEWCFIPTAMILLSAMYYYYGIIRSEQELSKRIRNQLILTSNDKQFLLRKIASLTKNYNKTVGKRGEKTSESK